MFPHPYTGCFQTQGPSGDRLHRIAGPLTLIAGVVSSAPAGRERIGVLRMEVPLPCFQPVHSPFAAGRFLS